MSDATEVTTVTNRHIKRGYEKEYTEWFGRMLNPINQLPGYRRVTSVVPGGSDPDGRIVLYRFADKTSMDKWENSLRESISSRR
jgi:antibiotic biosynthesis monooxygenase (ABM) superfamily enzyme